MQAVIDPLISLLLKLKGLKHINNLAKMLTAFNLSSAVVM